MSIPSADGYDMFVPIHVSMLLRTKAYVSV